MEVGSRLTCYQDSRYDVAARVVSLRPSWCVGTGRFRRIYVETGASIEFTSPFGYLDRGRL